MLRYDQRHMTFADDDCLRTKCSRRFEQRLPVEGSSNENARDVVRHFFGIPNRDTGILTSRRFPDVSDFYDFSISIATFSPLLNLTRCLSTAESNKTDVISKKFSIFDPLTLSLR